MHPGAGTTGMETASPDQSVLGVIVAGLQGDLTLFSGVDDA